MLFASFYTANGRYPQLAERLRLSLERFALPYIIKAMPDAGEWNRTCGQKAEFIIGLLLQHRQPIVWLDCDTTVVQPPVLLADETHDFAAYNWYADPHNRNGWAVDPNKLAVSGGVMKFGYTAAAIELLLRWSTRIRLGGLQDDPSLDDVFNTAKPPVNPLWLPQSYNRMDALFHDVAPVIDHEYRGGGHRTAQETQ